jgi:hypothetical protein
VLKRRQSRSDIHPFRVFTDPSRLRVKERGSREDAKKRKKGRDGRSSHPQGAGCIRMI